MDLDGQMQTADSLLDLDDLYSPGIIYRVSVVTLLLKLALLFSHAVKSEHLKAIDACGILLLLFLFMRLLWSDFPQCRRQGLSTIVRVKIDL